MGGAASALTHHQLSDELGLEPIGGQQSRAQRVDPVICDLIGGLIGPEAVATSREGATGQGRFVATSHQPPGTSHQKRKRAAGRLPTSAKTPVAALGSVRPTSYPLVAHVPGEKQQRLEGAAAAVGGSSGSGWREQRQRLEGAAAAVGGSSSSGWSEWVGEWVGG